MAQGYLGKISAIVSANTADFSSKLNQSARDVGKFAKTMESTLSSASRKAATSLAGIYTPLQRVERALRAAATQKLQFSGFAGAIKSVDALRERIESLGGLKQRQVDVILKASGLKSIDSFRNAIYGLKSKEFDLLVRVGGAEKLKEIRAQIASGVGEFAVVAETRQAEAKIRELTQRVDEAKQTAKTIVAVVDDSQVKSAKKELTDYVIAQSQALTGEQRVKPKAFRSDLNSRLAAEQAALGRAESLSRDRDSRLAAATTDKQRANINRDYPGLEGDIQKRTAEIKKLKASLAELDALEKKVASAKKGTGAPAASDVERYTAELDAAKKKHAELATQTQKKISLALGFDVPLEDIDALLDETISKGDALERIFREAGVGGEAALQKVINVLKDLGVSDLDANITQFRQLQDVAEQLQKPLNEAAKAAASLDLDSQGAFSKTLSEAQSRTEALVDQIREGDQPVARISARFQEALGWINKAVDGATRLKEASTLVGGLATGRELRFQNPAVAGALARSDALGKSATELPAAAIQANPRIAQSLIRVRTLSEDVAKSLAKVEDLAARGFDVDGSAAQQELAQLLQKLAEAQRLGEEQIKIYLDATDAKSELESLAAEIRGVSPTPVDRLRDAWKQAEAEVEKVTDSTTKARLSASLTSVAGDVKALGGISDAGKKATAEDAVAAKIAGVASEAVSQQGIEATAAADAAAAKELNDRVAGLQGAWARARSGLPQTQQEVDDFFQKVLDDIAKLDSVDDRVSFDDLIKEFLTLAGSGAGLTATTQKLLELEAAVKKAGAASSITPPKPEADTEREMRAKSFDRATGGNDLPLNLEATSLRGYEAQLQILSRRLSTVSSEARGPAADAFARLQAAIASAFRDGTLDTAESRKKIAGLTKEAVAATAAVSNASKKALTRDVARAGDIGRAGFDKFSLAMNQAAFAVDDFLSSTGGLEFKLRAISNNVTQLGFILGGTKGLFITLAAVIGGQAAVSLIKWVNDGKSAEDQTKALNDSLSKQKSIVDELAQAYQSLGREIARGTKSSGVDAVESILRQRRDVVRKRDEASVEGVRAGSAREGAVGYGGAIARFFEPFMLTREERFRFNGIVDERAFQNAQTKRRDESDDVAERANAEVELRMSRRRERDIANRLAARPLAPADNISARMQAFAESVMPQGGLGDVFAPGNAFTARGAAEDVMGVSRDIQDGNSTAAMAARIASLNEANEAANPIARQRGFLGMFQTTNAQRAKQFQADNKDEIKVIQRQLERRLAAAGDAVYAAMEQAAYKIRFAQEDVAAAIEKGVVAAAPLQELLNSLASELTIAQSDLERALTASPDELGVDAVQRERMISSARSRVESIKERQEVLAAGARSSLLGRQFGGQRSQSALSQLEGNDLFASQGVEGIAALRAAMNEESATARAAAMARSQQAAAEDTLNESRAALRQQMSATTRDDEAERRLADEVKAGEAALELARKNTNAATAAAALAARLSDARAATEEFRMSLEKSLGRTRKIGESAVSGRESFADDMATRLVEGRGVTLSQRDSAELRAIDARQRVEGLQNELTKARDDVMRTPAMEALQQERADLESRIRDDEAAARVSVGVLDPARSGEVMLANRQRLTQVNAEADRMMFGATRGQRFELDRERYEADQELRAFRGRDLGLTQPQRTVKEFMEGTGGDIIARTNRIPIPLDPQKYLSAAFREQRRELAPALAALEDERTSALLMGPSKQALQFSDSTTQQGQSELNRLLRGQDSAQDRNLVELNRQTGVLEQIRDSLEKETNVIIDMNAP